MQLILEEKNIQNTILDTLRASGKPLALFDLAEATQQSVDMLVPALRNLLSQGELALSKKERYALPEMLNLVVAKASALRNGTPIALPLDGSPSMKILDTNRLRSMPEDILLVRPENEETCTLVQIAQRGKQSIAAYLQLRRRPLRKISTKHRRAHRSTPEEYSILITAVACDRRIPYAIQVHCDDSIAPQNDQIALLEIDTYPEGDRPMHAHVLRILGDKSDMRARLRVIAEESGFSVEPEPCEALPSELTDVDLASREDLRDLLTFTIDGPFSKDFDDAVSLELISKDTYRLGVHIADVSHYVRPGSNIDRRARTLGTSLYLPGLTVPMLPEQLSNDLCSLLPDEDRLTLSLLMNIQNGKVVDHHLCTSVIHSHARLTYDAVNRLFDGDTDAVPANLHSTLMDMRTLSHAMRARREARGAIDLDLPEPEFVLDEACVPTDIRCELRGEAERIIEDFMLAANETIAALARATDTPLIYRIHERPDADRLAALELFLNNLNLPTHIGPQPHPGILRGILQAAESMPAVDTVRRMLLRSLKRARYSDTPVGHYALAMDDYCHFTSPIRRYPDLVVHRMMKKLLCGTSTEHDARVMSELANLTSLREQAATLAERDADDLMKACYMQSRIGHKYTGTISGVTAWGLYVTLPNGVEGLVHIATLDEYYDYDRERNQLVAFATGNTFRLGERVRIRVENADLDRREIDFTLLPVRYVSYDKSL